jgi:protein phosphatase
VLIGPSGSGKSTFARRHFKSTEILASDMYRALVADDQSDQAATDAAFEVLHLIAAKRLEAGRLTVIDATNVQPESRRPLVDLAKMYHRPAVAIVFDLAAATSRERNSQRVDRRVGNEVIGRQRTWLHRSMRFLDHEGFHVVHILDSEEAVTNAAVSRRRAG